MSLATPKATLRHIFTLGLALLISSCGGGDITFPQAPTSGAGGLGMTAATVSLEGSPSSELVVQLEPANQTFRFFWAAPANKVCTAYRLLIVQDPGIPVTTVSNYTVLRTILETTAISHSGDAELTQFVRLHTLPLLTVVACVTPEAQANATIPLPRSNFVAIQTVK